ncbi:MAG: hypothetical protein AB7N80_16010 [Bdellovibrionales bacterium]
MRKIHLLYFSCRLKRVKLESVLKQIILLLRAIYWLVLIIGLLKGR